MLFLLQTGYNDLDIDMYILKEELKKQHYTHDSLEITLEILMNNFNNYNKDAITVGTLDFVGFWLKEKFNIQNMNPIEVPDELRKEKYLKRKYSIRKKEDLPKSGYYFTKYVSKLKEFTHIGQIDTLQYVDIDKEPFLKDGLYQVSEVVDILAEYRVFVQNNEVKYIAWYDGKPVVQLDMSLLLEMVGVYSLSDSRPNAYTMDIAVIKDRGTAILEVHPWVSVGLYGYMFGSYLPYAYRDGLDYYKNINKEITVYSNF